MNEGIELVAILSKLSMCNIHIWGNCFNCIEPNCAEQLGELDRSLRRLLELLELEQRRNVTELLCLARHAKDKQDDLEKKQDELEKKVDVILRGQQEIHAMLMEQQDVIRRIVSNSEQQAPLSSEGGAANPALGRLGVVFRQLFDAVAQVTVENMMFKRLLKTFKSTLYCIQPLIEEITEHSRVLHLPNQEAEKLILQIENGVEYVLKCSKVGKHANYKKYKHTNKILDLNESFQKLFIELKGQVERNVKEAIDSADKIEMAIRKIEAELDLCDVQLPEHPSPAIGIDIHNMQGLRDVSETLLDSTSVEDEGLQRTEDNRAVQSQINIQGSFDVPPQVPSHADVLHVLKMQRCGRIACTEDRLPYASPTPSSYSSCFTPSESKSSASFADSVFSYASGAGSERRRVSRYSQEVYANLNESRKERQAGSVKFTMDEIYRATKNFSPSVRIGQGGFGTVYKGRLEDGTLVAIKRAKKGENNEHLVEEFQSEIQMLSQVEHMNLVKFYGYVEYEDEKVVVLEYVPNGNLRQHLDCMQGNILDLAARIDIAIDVAHAVTYLHMYTDHPIIHRDIKSSHILLTEKLRAKVADFGLARLGADSDSGATLVSTPVKGTAGYLDPEYIRTYQFTDKSDVYSFGVLLVELVTGRRPLEPKREFTERITAKWAMKKFSDGDALLIMDPRLEKNAANNLAIENILELSLQCLAQRGQHRPSMKRCAEILWSIRKDYKEISAPEFCSSTAFSQRSSSTRED
ncbi:PREDICTED: uncharacterized protein LOC101311627 [Fragaria vesca subsp. vesca]